MLGREGHLLFPKGRGVHEHDSSFLWVMRFHVRALHRHPQILWRGTYPGHAHVEPETLKTSKAGTCWPDCLRSTFTRCFEGLLNVPGDLYWGHGPMFKGSWRLQGGGSFHVSLFPGPSFGSSERGARWIARWQGRSFARSWPESCGAAATRACSFGGRLRAAQNGALRCPNPTC